MARESAAVLTLTCVLAFVLLVVTCCSAPTSRDINLFRVTSPSQGSQLDAGILGICIGPTGRSSSLRSVCSDATLGYEIFVNGPQAFRFGTSGSREVVASADLTRAMVLTPIATALAGLATIVAAIAWVSGHNQPLELSAIVITSITTAVTWVAFAINIAVSAKVKEGVDSVRSQLLGNQNLVFAWGAATFLPLGAAVVLSAALGWAIFDYSRKRRYERSWSDSTATNMHDQPWQEKRHRR